MVMVALFMVSCDTDDSIKCPDALIGELNATENQFSGTWVFSAMEADVAVDITDDDEDNPSKDIFAQYSLCQSDLVYNFMDDRNYTYKQGYSAADCQNKLQSTGTWALTGDKSLTFVANCASETVRITTSEAGNTFSYETNLNFQDVNGIVKATKVTFTYTKEGEVVTPQ